MEEKTDWVSLLQEKGLCGYNIHIEQQMSKLIELSVAEFGLIFEIVYNAQATKIQLKKLWKKCRSTNTNPHRKEIHLQCKVIFPLPMRLFECNKPLYETYVMKRCLVFAHFTFYVHQLFVEINRFNAITEDVFIQVLCRFLFANELYSHIYYLWEASVKKCLLDSELTSHTDVWLQKMAFVLYSTLIFADPRVFLQWEAFVTTELLAITPYS
ncbi:hypothetical protein RFI_12752 [Reticulomyxa filosa]|uniref:Uncharacterized protein n=1 Tax=Reticulomyxa filosa TaxID=46433 RepID=X6NEN0_RETFI|nr:hypothetical protein RFI_12752 [Reticulomyxa filosa]|eukprot:ETO24406.1 hypothetical protein RFI_12752 [Reticulomyxa filosa]